MCYQQRLSPVCEYAQTDQSLCLSLEYSISVKLLTEHHLEFLTLKGGCTGSSDSTLDKIPHCWKSHVTAHRRWHIRQTDGGNHNDIVIASICLPDMPSPKFLDQNLIKFVE